jgi:hypothetical protein
VSAEFAKINFGKLKTAPISKQSNETKTYVDEHRNIKDPFFDD